MLPRFALQADTQTLAEWANVPAEASVPPRATHPHGRELTPVLRANGKEREIVWMRPGLIPSYACDDQDAEQRSEAHAEAMTCDTCFRSAFRRRRCIVPATILHEVRHLSSGVVHPCSFSLESGDIFGIAAVWETWINDEGHAVNSFAIITVLVTPLLRTLFERMPVILTDTEQQDRWLQVQRGEEPPVDLLRPLSSRQLRAWQMTPGNVQFRLHEDGVRSVSDHPEEVVAIPEGLQPAEQGR